MNNTKSLIIQIIKRDKRFTILLFLAIIGVVTLSLIPPQILKIIVDRYLNQGLGSQLWNISLLYFVILLLIGVFDFAKEGLLTVYGQKIIKEIRLEMMKKLKRVPSLYFTNNETGAIVSRFTNDVDTIQFLFTNGIIGMVIDFFKIIGIIVSICLFSRSLGAIVFLLIPVIYFITRFFQTQMLKVQLKNRILVSLVNNHVPETINNFQMIKSFHIEKYMEEKYKEYLTDSCETIDQINFYDSLFSPIILVIRAVVIAMIVLLTYHNKIFGMSIGMTAASIELISNIFQPIENFGMELQSIQQAVAGIKRVDELLNETEDKTKTLEIKNEDIKTHNISIEFKNVSFSYEAGQEILKHVSFKILPLEDVTFKGRTGAGKSTLFKLILGLLEPTGGNILIGNKEAILIKNSEKRKLFGYVEQNFHFIPGTVLEQISMKDAAIKRDDVVNAVTFVGLHDYILNLEHGYDTVALEHMFSQGQKQLLSIARAIVVNPPIMLLDEITANLDSDTENKIIAILKKAGKGRTLLSISHRLSGQLSCDRLITLVNAAIKEKM